MEMWVDQWGFLVEKLGHDKLYNGIEFTAEVEKQFSLQF